MFNNYIYIYIYININSRIYYVYVINLLENDDKTKLLNENLS